MKRVLILTAAGLASISLLAAAAMAKGSELNPDGAPTATSSSGGFLDWLSSLFSRQSNAMGDPDG